MIIRRIRLVCRGSSGPRACSRCVTIDAKTTSSPALQDQQVDWVTLAEHRVKHGADVAMLIGPNPTSRRLLERAQSQGIAVLSADALADLCCRHAATPLGLADYKGIFERGGSADLAHIKKRSEEAGPGTSRLHTLRPASQRAGWVCRYWQYCSSEAGSQSSAIRARPSPYRWSSWGRPCGAPS